MPTYEVSSRFQRDIANLSPQQRQAVRKAIRAFVADLRKGTFRPGLRVKGIQGAIGVFEMTWASDGRCTFEYGPEVLTGEPHIIWRRCGTHDIFRKP